MSMSVIWHAFRWGESAPRVESVPIPTVGSKLRVLPEHSWAPLPPHLEYATSADGQTWSEWTPIKLLEAVDVPFPGYFMFRAAQAGRVRWHNYKTPNEADTVVGLTVVLGESEVRVYE